MSLPALYKYLDVQGAKLTLGNRSFKHAKPSDFNDTEDLTIQSLFPEDHEMALKQLESSFSDVLLNHLNDPPTCINPDLREKVALIQSIYKNNPSVAQAIKEAKARGESKEVFDREYMKKRHGEFVDEINQFMQDFRVLCVSALNNSNRMWERYAQGHQGVVLRILPNVQKDSKYQLFRPVVYRETRPPLYESVLSFQEGSLFGDQEARIRIALETIIYSKTLCWEYEKEYRLAIPLARDERDWNTLAYHSDEISELYLGAHATDNFTADIVGLAQATNPQMKIFQMFHDRNGKLSYRAR